MKAFAKRFFPFLNWFSELKLSTLRADLVAGVTVALVLIPQSMAYAQLAGLPAYYGLYAAFLPPLVAALFGSSRQLATGPVAVVSLMTAASLEPLATAGSERFIMYAVFLALVVGLFQLLLGILRLGVIVNFLSHPVVNGFTNAAAIIIATSQLSKLFGVYVDKADHHYETIMRVVAAAWHYTHWPSLLLAILAFAIMYGIKRFNPRIPFVLVAVVVTSVIAWATDFENQTSVSIDALRAPEVTQTIRQFNETVTSIAERGEERLTLSQQLENVEEDFGERSPEYLELSHQLELLQLRLSNLKSQAQAYRERLRSFHLYARTDDGELGYYTAETLPEGAETDGRTWRLQVGNTQIDAAAMVLSGGGAVVGSIPEGLPALSLPNVDLGLLLRFLPAAAIISLLGFMEAISIAKAMAAKTRQRLDPNQELIGQGLANIVGSFGQSYPVSGSFSRSAVNISAGAITGMSSVFTSAVVIVTLLLFTPLLYYIPQSVLAAVIMMAVVGLVNVRGFLHAYRAQRYDGIIAIISFVFTLALAPHLDQGILVGVVLSIGHYLYRNSRPTIATLSLHPDESLRDARKHGLQECKYIAVIRFEGPLFFGNTNYLEDRVNELVETMPSLSHIMVSAGGINEVDASGEEMLSLLLDRLRSQDVEISFVGLNENVRALFRRTHLLEKIGEEHIFPSEQRALEVIHPRAHVNSDEKACPLMTVLYKDPDAHAPGQPAAHDCRVLLVTNHREQIASTIRWLRRRGIQVIVEKSVETALQRLHSLSCDVIVIESAEPSVADALKLLRAERRDAHAIAIEGEALLREGDKEHLEIVRPPIDGQRLLKAINRATVAARASSAPHRPRTNESPNPASALQEKAQ